MRRRQLLLLVGSATSGAMAVGTGAFSSVSAERNVTMDVVGDEDAYLGIEADDTIVIYKDNSETDILTIFNQFPVDISLTISETDESSGNVLITEFDNRNINIGESDSLAAKCSADGRLKLKFDAKIKDSDDQIVEAERSYNIVCKDSEQKDESEEASVEYNGAGTVEIISNNTFEDITVYYVNNKRNGNNSSKKINNTNDPEFETSDKLKKRFWWGNNYRC